jgi:septum formation protein
VLGADTVVVDAGRALGKPRDRADALAMLADLSGRTHEVLTAVAVATEAGVQLALSRSKVVFRTLASGEAERYWESGEPADKAGAYGIQGIGGIFVDRLEGSHSGVVGLPLAETERLLRAAGIDTWRHRVPPDRVAPDDGLDTRTGGDRPLDEP